jgi:hypothetical protein
VEQVRSKKPLSCRSKLPAVQPFWLNFRPQLPITELKWDARTVTDIPGNTAHWFFAFFWLTEGSRNKKNDIYIKQIPLCSYLLRYLVIRAAMGIGTTIMTQFSSTSGLQDSLTYMYYTSKCLYMSLLYRAKMGCQDPDAYSG